MSLTSLPLQLDYDELEAQSHRLLGHFFAVFANVELTLSLRVGDEGNFHQKLGRFLGSSIESIGSEESYCEILAWYMGADSMREMRNRLAHGRWGYLVHLQRVVHVSGYPPSPQDERCFSLGDLHALVQDAHSINNDLIRLSS